LAAKTSYSPAKPTRTLLLLPSRGIPPQIDQCQELMPDPFDPVLKQQTQKPVSARLFLAFYFER
jgi:hypothetical protein